MGTTITKAPQAFTESSTMPVMSSGPGARPTGREATMARIGTAITALSFLALFLQPLTTLMADWWNVPEAGHGLLLAPVALWLAWRSGLRADAIPQPAFGAVVLVLAVLLRFASGLAAELFTMRGSMIIALVGIVIYFRGMRQVMHWWLPILLVALSIPLPELVTQALALPLQFKASEMGAALLKMRHVPVLLAGNVIRLPGHELFVTEACSGLRSLTALISTAVLLAALAFRSPVTRTILVLLAIPIAVVINGVRVFLTGFLVFFVSPKFGTGFMHATEGWLLFLVSLGTLGLLAWLIGMVERRMRATSESRDA
jgi:exosortase